MFADINIIQWIVMALNALTRVVKKDILEPADSFLNKSIVFWHEDPVLKKIKFLDNTPAE